jgi:hypothetical protein
LLIYKNNLIAGTRIAREAQAEINMTRSKFFDRFLSGVRRMKKHLLALALIAATGAANAGMPSRLRNGDQTIRTGRSTPTGTLDQRLPHPELLSPPLR